MKLPSLPILSSYVRPLLSHSAPVLALALIFGGCNGCSLNQQIPKATIEFSNPVTGQKVAINSHKDVELKDVRVTFDTNGSPTIAIGSYTAKSNIEVVKAAIQAQQQQIAGIQAGLEKVVAAAVSGAAKP